MTVSVMLFSLLLLLLLLYPLVLVLVALVAVVAAALVLVVRVLGTTVVLDDGQSGFKNDIQFFPQPLQCTFSRSGTGSLKSLLKSRLRGARRSCMTFLSDGGKICCV